MKTLLASAVVAAFAGSASAAVFQQDQNFSFPLSPGSQNVSFLGFQSIPGYQPGWILDSVVIRIDATIGANVTAENDAAIPTTGFGLSLTGLSNFDIGNLSANAGINEVVAGPDRDPSDGVPGSGTDFFDFGFVSGNDNDDDFAFSAIDLAAFDIAGNIAGLVNGSAGFSVTGTSDSSLDIVNLAANGTATVIYNYTIPAPGAAALFGLAGLAAARRRR